MRKEEFIQRLRAVKSATSEQGKLYINIKVVGNSISYTRESGSVEQVSIEELFHVYQTLTFPVLQTFSQKTEEKATNSSQSPNPLPNTLKASSKNPQISPWSMPRSG